MEKTVTAVACLMGNKMEKKKREMKAKDAKNKTKKKQACGTIINQQQSQPSAASQPTASQLRTAQFVRAASDVHAARALHAFPAAADNLEISVGERIRTRTSSQLRTAPFAQRGRCALVRPSPTHMKVQGGCPGCLLLLLLIAG